MTELCGPRWPGRRRDSACAATTEQLNARIEDVAQLLLGPANGALSTRTQLRFGRQGSLAVELAGDKRGQWYDHENKIGGGALDLNISGFVGIRLQRKDYTDDVRYGG